MYMVELQKYCIYSHYTMKSEGVICNNHIDIHCKQIIYPHNTNDQHTLRVKAAYVKTTSQLEHTY